MGIGRGAGAERKRRHGPLSDDATPGAPRYRGLSEVIADRLHGQPADRPESKSKDRHHPERAPAPRVEGFLRQAWRDEAGDIDLLAIGVAARLVEAMQGMLIGGFGKPALAVQ